MFNAVLIICLFSTPTISLLAKITLFLLLITSFTIMTLEKWSYAENLREKMGLMIIIIITTVLISQALATPWIIIIIEIQTYIMLSSGSWLKGSPKLIFNEACLTYMFPAALSTFTMCIGFIVYLKSGLNSVYPSIFISLALLIKIGAVPFYIWIKTVYRGISWSGIIILGILNKIGIIVILSANIPSGYTIYFLIGILTIVVGSIMASNQIGLKELWGFSGIASMGLILVLLYVAKLNNYSSTLIYCFIDQIIIFLTIYALSLLAFICIISKANINSQNQINFSIPKLNKSMTHVYVMILSLLSVAGIPPFAGFIVKFMLLSEISSLTTGNLTVLILLLNLPLIMAYLRLINKLVRLESYKYSYNIFSETRIPKRITQMAVTITLINMLASLLIVLRLM